MITDYPDAAFAAHLELLTRREDLHPDLKPYLVKMRFGGMMLKHPLVFSAIHTDQMNAWANNAYHAKSEAVRRHWRLDTSPLTSGCTSDPIASRR